MRIEPIGSYPYRPYIYNTNQLSRSSLSKVKPIEEDVLASKTDFSGLTEKQENINPLRKGETPNFTQIFEMQMQKGRMNAARVMKPKTADENDTQDVTKSAANAKAGQAYRYQMQRAIDAYSFNMTA